MTENNEIEDQHANDSKYILGIFYFNRNDKRLFPRKSAHSLGWTINFANPFSIAAAAALIVFAIYFREIMETISHHL